MNDGAIIEIPARAGDAKKLYRESFFNLRSPSVQPNPGRIQQHGKESYLRWWYVTHDEFQGIAFTCVQVEGYCWASPISDRLQTVQDESPPLFLYKLALKATKGSLSTGSTQTTLQKEMASFVERANRLDKRGQTDAALDLIYDQVDTLLRSGDFARTNEALDAAEIPSLSLDMLLGLLTATLPAKTRLASRKTFFSRAEQELKRRGEWQNGLLAGLES